MQGKAVKWLPELCRGEERRGEERREEKRREEKRRGEERFSFVEVGTKIAFK